jgi:hypothetical protein
MSGRLRKCLLAIGLLVAAAILLVRHQLGIGGNRESGPTEVTILEPEETVRVSPTGPASSVQEAEIVVSRDLLERIWTPDSLELLARGYWGFLRRAFLGLIEVHYAHDSRTVTALGKIPLLRFGAPQFETSEERGQVTWPVDSGILVARDGRGKGHLRVSVRRCDRDGVDDAADAERDQVRLIASVEVANFYPGLRGTGRFSRWGAWFYAQTQLRIHVIVCNAFLRSLPNLDFPDVDTTSMPSERAGELEDAA